jgi:aryl-alcohol dehydrogenase-like predicted oxidoreductase
MKRIQLGRTGATVPVLGLGCAGMSHSYGNADEQESLGAMRAALDHGMNLFDTAESYGAGHNEELVGRFIRDVGRDRVLVASKCGHVRRGDGTIVLGNEPDYIAAACDASLKRLGVDAIDIYYIHRRDPGVPLADSIGAMSRLVEAGKVRWIGLSEVSGATLRAANDIHPIAALESEYSLTTRDPEDGILQSCRELGVTFVAFSPLGRALLTATLTPSKLAENDFRRRLPRFSGEAAERNVHLVERFAAFCAARGATPAQMALAWLVSKNDGDTRVAAIPGTKRAKYLPENAAAADINLTPEDSKELDLLFNRNAVGGARYAGTAAQIVGT